MTSQSHRQFSIRALILLVAMFPVLLPFIDCYANDMEFGFKPGSTRFSNDGMGCGCDNFSDRRYYLSGPKLNEIECHSSYGDFD